MRIAAERTPDLPFFEADYVQAALATRALGGVVAFDELAVTNGRLRVMRDRDGRMNLPDSSDTPSGEPAPLNIAHLSAPRLLVDVKDEQNDLSLAVPGITLDIGRAQGRVALERAGHALSRRKNRLAGLHAGWRRIVRWPRAQVDRSLTAYRRRRRSGLDGDVSLLVRDPAIDLRARGTADLERLARWGMRQW